MARPATDRLLEAVEAEAGRLWPGQGCVQSLACLTLSGLDCDMLGLGAGDGGQSTTCR